MATITAGDGSGAPYRRLDVLENLEGLAYESPDPNNIETTMAKIGGSGTLLPQLENILSKLHQEKLAVFKYGDPGVYGYGSWSEKVQIINLDLKLLSKLKLETEEYITNRNKAQDDKHALSKPSARPKQNDTNNTSHPILTGIFVTVVGGLILAIILSHHRF